MGEGRTREPFAREFWCFEGDAAQPGTDLHLKQTREKPACKGIQMRVKKEVGDYRGQFQQFGTTGTRAGGRLAGGLSVHITYEKNAEEDS
jgi:hypothetical protein